MMIPQPILINSLESHRKPRFRAAILAFLTSFIAYPPRQFLLYYLSQRHRQRHRSSASPTEIQKFRHQFTGDQHSLYHGTIGWALGLKVAVLGLTRSSLIQMVTRRR